MNRFDEWVGEAPFRHSAIFALLVVATIAVLTGA